MFVNNRWRFESRTTISFSCRFGVLQRQRRLSLLGRDDVNCARTRHTVREHDDPAQRETNTGERAYRRRLTVRVSSLVRVTIV
jgi:hypothetical protein